MGPKLFILKCLSLLGLLDKVKDRKNLMEPLKALYPQLVKQSTFLQGGREVETISFSKLGVRIFILNPNLKEPPPATPRYKELTLEEESSKKPRPLLYYEPVRH